MVCVWPVYGLEWSMWSCSATVLDRSACITSLLICIELLNLTSHIFVHLYLLRLPPTCLLSSLSGQTGLASATTSEPFHSKVMSSFCRSLKERGKEDQKVTRISK